MRRREAAAGNNRALAILLCAGLSACASPRSNPGVDPEVISRGSVEVTAELVEIRGEFPSNDLYDYVYVMEYEVAVVHRGEVPDDVIYVGHYNPLKPRAEAADARVPDIGGQLLAFQAGDTHRMALEPDIDAHYMGGIINKYAEETSAPIYWAVWTNLVEQ